MLKWSQSRTHFKLIGGRKIFSLPPLAYLSCAFAAGIAGSFYFSIPFFPLLIIALIGLICLVASLVRLWFIPAGIIFFFVLGFLYGLNDSTLPQNHIFLTAPEGRLSLEGTVVSVPETIKHGRKETVSFVLESRNFFRSRTLYRTQGKIQVFLHNCGREIHYGDELRLKGSLEAPKKVTNPSTFDYGLYLAHQGIFNIFRGIGSFSVQRQSPRRNGLLLWVNQLRSGLQLRISKLYPSPHSELASALILGFRKNIPDEVTEQFIKTGTAHLLAISGLNISLVVALFYFVMSFLRIPRQVNFLMTIIFILLYTTLAGANIPVLRAGIMGCVIFTGFLFSQERNLKSAFFFSFFLLLALSPSALRSASFQLSFLAMASLLYILPRLEAKLLPKIPKAEERILPPTWIERTIFFCIRSTLQSFLASLAATIGMFPVLLWYFNLFSMIGFICNLIAIPLCTLATASTFILLVIDFIYSPLALFLSSVPLLLFRFELWFIYQLARVPLGHVYLPSPNLIFFIFYYGWLMVWLIPAKLKRLNRLSVSMLACSTAIFLLSSQIPKSRSVLFDVGKNEAFFISYSNGAKCLVNTGRKFPNNQAYWIIRSFLMSRSVHRLDAVLLTRLDAVHAGGLRTIQDYVNTAGVFTTSRDFRKINSLIGPKYKTLKQGDRIQFGSSPDLYLEILTVLEGNVTSFISRDQDKTFLFILSYDAKTFASLLQANTLDYDVVYLPHHEFPISQAEKDFLARISPQYLILNQRKNVEAFKPEIQRLVRSQVLSVEQLGALELIKSGNRLTYKGYLKPGISSHSYFLTA